MNLIRGLALLAAVLVLLAGCSNLAETPDYSLETQVTFGTPDGEAHPYVGTLLFVQDGVGYYSCTGTLLSSTVMLTAGHCVMGDDLNDVTYVRFTENAMEDRADYESFQAWLDAEWIEADKVIAHPEYDNLRTWPNTYDIGLVILAEEDAVELDTYGQLPEIGLLDSLMTRRGQQNRTFTAVGYGMQGVINPFYQDDYVRYQSQVSLIEIRSTFTGDSHSAKFSNNPGKGNGRGGTCFGDSGGPLFHGDSNIIGAIVSWGITPCIGVDYQFRIDTPIAQEFINPYLNPGVEE